MENTLILNDKTTKEQQDHLINGGEMIYFVIDKVITEWNTIFCEYKGRKRNFYFKKELIKELSPIQPNTKYYLQEECIGDCNIGLPCQSCGSSQDVGTTEREFEFDVEIKRIQDLEAEDCNAIRGLQKEFMFWDDCLNELAMFEEEHNNLHPNQPYESNPYIITAKVKR